MIYLNYIFFISTLCFFVKFNSYSQLIIKPIFHNHLEKKNGYDNEEIDTINLPIFEDFSRYSDSISQSYIWSSTKSIQIRDLPDNIAPTLKVAVFDGIDQYGNPYNESSQFVGLADSLTSNIINLENYSGSQTVYFSFFWNINKYSEYPDEDDSIRLQFLGINNNWETVWKVNGKTSVDFEIFDQEIINLNTKFLHSNFRFRFQNFGKLNGPFDSWTIDYIYLNKDRELNDTIYIDRSLTYKPKNIFGDFTSIPIEQFTSEPNSFLDTIHVGFNNLNNQIQPIEYNCIVYDEIKKEPVDTISWKVPVNPIIQGFEKRIIKSSTIKTEKFIDYKDSIVIKIKFFINSGDTIINNIDYRINDTSESIYKIKDYYSYDDGKADYAAGINQQEGEVVVMYILNRADTITHLEMYWPKIYPNSQGKKITLLLYKKLNDDRINLIGNNSVDILINNSFNSYKLNSPIIVSDTIYIGFKQFSNEFIPIGLDKNHNNSDKIYFNTNGIWEQNNLINGSLMIRPRFSKVTEYLTLIEDNFKKDFIRIYPNPTDGIIKLNKEIDGYLVYSMQGKILFSHSHKTNTINLKNLKNGMYLIVLKYKNESYLKRVIKSQKLF